MITTNNCQLNKYRTVKEGDLKAVLGKKKKKT